MARTKQGRKEYEYEKGMKAAKLLKAFFHIMESTKRS